MNGSRPPTRSDDPPTPMQGSSSAGSTASSLTRSQFGEQLQGCYRLLWMIAAGIIPDRHSAEDVVHEAALTALARLDQFQEGSSFSAWMAQIVRYVALNHARKEKRRQGVAFAGDDIEALPDRSMSGLREHKEVMDAEGRLRELQPHFDDDVCIVLNELDATARTCLLLRTVEGLAYKEIAEVLKIPQGTAMSHVHRSRRQLRQRLLDRTILRESPSSDPHGSANRDRDGLSDRPERKDDHQAEQS